MLQQYDVPNHKAMVVWDSGYRATSPSTIRSGRRTPAKFNLLDIEAWVRFGPGRTYVGRFPFYPSRSTPNVTPSLEAYVESKRFVDTVSAADMDSAAAAVLASLKGRDNISDQMIYGSLYSDVGGGQFTIEVTYFTGKMFVREKP